jgi:hypothetical protein
VTPYSVRWTDTITSDRRVTTVQLANGGTPDLFPRVIAAAALGGFQDEGRVHIDSYEEVEAK